MEHVTFTLPDGSREVVRAGGRLFRVLAAAGHVTDLGPQPAPTAATPPAVPAPRRRRTRTKRTTPAGRTNR